MKVIKYITLTLLLTTYAAKCQNLMTSSPYSMFGIGEIVTGLYGQNVSMGRVAIGMRNPWLLNSDNPAGLTGLDSLKLFAEASVFVKQENYQSKGANNRAFTGNLSSFMLGGRIMPRWYMAAGLTPYSSVGYYFQSSQPLEGVPGSEYISTFEGYGGLSSVYLTNAVQLSTHLSMGVNLNYIVGNMMLTESQEGMTVENKMYTHAFSADFGLQYYRSLSQDAFLTLGAIYGYQQKLSIDNSVTITSSTAESSQNKKKTNQYLPQYWGGGGSLKYKKMTYGLDYLFHQYSSLSSGDTRVTFSDSHEIRTGVCYSPEGYSSSGLWKRMSYKAGLDVSTPYLNISGNSGISWRASLGLTFPVQSGRINTSLFYDQTQLTGHVLTRNQIGLIVTYTLSELFYKLKL